MEVVDPLAVAGHVGRRLVRRPERLRLLPYIQGRDEIGNAIQQGGRQSVGIDERDCACPCWLIED